MVEKDFDEIANGNKVWNEMIDNFYGPFHEQVKKTDETTRKFSGARLLGTDPESGKNVFVKMGRFGPVVQIGDTESEEKPKFAGLKAGQSLDTINLEDALDLFNFPRTIGEYEGGEIQVLIGRYGPYLKHKNQFFSISKKEDPGMVDQDRAIEIIEAKRKLDKEKVIKTFDKEPDLQILRGPYGPYISYKKKNFRIPKSKDPAALSLEDCMKIIESAPAKNKGRRKK
jgi:DNA topoisomerase-1